MIETVETQSRGSEVKIKISLKRVRAGLQVHVQGSSNVEDTIRDLSVQFRPPGEPETVPIKHYGVDWLAPPGKELTAYAGDFSRITSPTFTLVGLGANQMITEDGQANLSFLRLIGMSSPEGVSFTVRGLFLRHTVERIMNSLSKAAKEFYEEVLKPLSYSVVVITKEERA